MGITSQDLREHTDYVMLPKYGNVADETNTDSKLWVISGLNLRQLMDNLSNKEEGETDIYKAAKQVMIGAQDMVYSDTLKVNADNGITIHKMP